MSYGIKEDQNMPRKKHTPEEIVAKLRQVDVLVSQGVATAEAVGNPPVFGGGSA
jgi:hypothetical protein